MEILQQQESYAEALALGDNLLSDATISKAVKATTARRMFYSYLYGKQDVQKATEYVQLLYGIESDELEKAYLEELVVMYTLEDKNQSDGKIDEPALQNESSLSSSNYPNPFNPTTTIKYTLDQDTDVSLKVYNMLGKTIATLVDTRQSSGTYKIPFDASGLSSGIYFYRIKAGNESLLGRMTLIK